MRFSSRGFILVTTLILMLILSCITIPMLIQAQLSQKLAGSATLSFQLRHSAQSIHERQLQQIRLGKEATTLFVAAPCPAAYAAWSDTALICEWHQVRTTENSARQQHSVTSFLVRQSLSEGGRDDAL